MKFKRLAIQSTESGHYAVTDAETVIDFCPCCTKPLTLAAAAVIVARIEREELTFPDLTSKNVQKY